MNTIIEKIRAEIEHRIDQNREGENSYYDVNDIKNAGICRHKRILCEELLSFLSDLEKEEKPTTAEGVEDILLEFYDEYDSNVANRPIIPRIYAEKLARHFAQWGAEHYLKLESLAKFAEMTGPIDTMPKNALPPSKECEKGLREPLVSDDLEEAAKKFVGYDMDTDDLRDYEIGVSSFKAGAKWQEEQDLKYISEIYRNGYNLCKEQMMKEAVEGIVTTRSMAGNIVTAHIDHQFKDGQKVKLIIVKED